MKNNVLVIVTQDDQDSDDKKLWHCVKEKYFKDDAAKKFYKKNITNEKIVIIVKQTDNKETTETIITSLEQKNQTEKEQNELYIATHVKLDTSTINFIDQKFIKQCLFHHTKNTEPYDIIKNLIDSLCADKQVSNALCDNFNKLWDFIKKNIPLNFLIALSILCQGYLAAHEGKGVEGWDKLSDDLKNAAKTNWTKVKNNWWEPAFGIETEFGNTGVGKDLKAMGKDCGRAVVELFNTIQESNGKNFADTDKVTKAYGCIKEILKGK